VLGLTFVAFGATGSLGLSLLAWSRKRSAIGAGMLHD
jgi:hypothetical protein